MPEAPILRGAADMAAHLGVPKRWLLTEAEAGRVPSLRVGGRTLFDADATAEAIRKRMRAAPPQPAQAEEVRP